MSIDLACVIYADAEEPKLTEIVQQLWPANSFPLYVYNNEIEILKNLDFDVVRRQQFPDGFLHFRLRVEIFPDESKNISLENQLTMISALLNHLWSQNIPAVAACDYEDQLPENGGYKSRQIPWTT